MCMPHLLLSLLWQSRGIRRFCDISFRQLCKLLYKRAERHIGGLTGKFKDSLAVTKAYCRCRPVLGLRKRLTVKLYAWVSLVTCLRCLLLLNVGIWRFIDKEVVPAKYKHEYCSFKTRRSVTGSVKLRSYNLALFFHSCLLIYWISSYFFF